jgi:2-amino-4-hydroxy-6-hydroxymethyldihydropteridine diphosphokinase
VPKDVAFVALGSNLGDRDEHLRRARAALRELPKSSIIAESAVEETAPLGGMAQGLYLNQMVAIETDLTPRELLTELQRIERAAGREREFRWGPRTLDLDIVCFEHQSADESDLRVPHPAAGSRDFWLRELAELREQLGRP